ncbi:MAG: DNA cytosine methyltransferase, partial [Planctomycetota bacterium]
MPANPMPQDRIKAIEFFAGIGGFAYSWPTAQVVAAYDISELCQQVYEQNHPGSFITKEIASLSAEELTNWQADLWWMSPPCQPFTSRGNEKDIQDPRCAALLHLMDLIPKCLPSQIGLENVAGFRDSQAMQRLVATLKHSGYTVQSCDCCPSQLGWPNRRPRFHLLAARDPSALRPWQDVESQPSHHPRSPRLKELVMDQQVNSDPEVWLEPEKTEAFEDGLDRVSADDANAVTACFGSSYGKSILQAGSYLQTTDGLRRFTPREVARLMGFPEDLDMGGLSIRQQWKV